MKRKGNLVKVILNFDIMIASVALAALVGCTFAGVIARYVVGRPFGWIEEIQAALIVWVVFGAGGAAYRTGNHSAIELLFDGLPKPVQRIVKILVGMVVLAVLGFLCCTSINYIKLFIQTGRTTAVLNLPFTLIYAIVPISCVLQIFNYFLVDFFGYQEEGEILSQGESLEEKQKTDEGEKYNGGGGKGE